MNIRSLIAHAIAAIVITGTAVALVPGSAQAYGSLRHGTTISKPVTLNWYHHRHHHHRHYWH